VSHTPGTLVVDPTTFVHVEDKHYVIERAGQRRPIADVEASNRASISPDGTRLALVHAFDPPPLDRTQPREEIVVVAIADLAVRRYAIPATAPESPYLMIDWTKSGDALLIYHDGFERLALADGTLTQVTKEDYQAQRFAPDLLACPARGTRLVERSRDGRQELVVMATASEADPEHLASTSDRVLVASTDHRSSGGQHFNRSDAGPLEPLMFTPSCEHFVFSLQGSLYVGNVATARYARLTQGRLVFPRTH
jgi:hypothetical protein